MLSILVNVLLKKKPLANQIYKLHAEIQ